MRLTDLDKETFTRSLVERVIGHHITRLMFDLSPEARIEGLREGWQGTSIGLAAYLLCHYAQTGEPPGDAPIAEYLQTYCEALYTRPGDATSYDVPILDHVSGEPTESHELVLVAAVARARIASNEPVSLLHLAVLSTAGPVPLAYQSVRKLAASGEIQTTGERGRNAMTVSAAEATRWLQSRSVPI